MNTSITRKVDNYVNSLVKSWMQSTPVETDANAKVANAKVAKEENI